MSILLGKYLEFLAGETPYSKEMQSLAMAFQGALAVRRGPNSDGKMHFFHAFALVTIIGFGGGWFGFLWMGKPTPMITNGDINVMACIIAFITVNYSPFDIGLKAVTSFPAVIIITSYAQLFRFLGMIRFITTAFNEVSPSPYYPIPVIGPVLYATLLGNWGGFFLKGFHGHLQNGIPWPFQNGIIMGTFYHLFAHDVDGPLGKLLRGIIYSILGKRLVGDIDDKTFAFVVTGVFMQVTGFLMLPQFLGPSFSIFISPFQNLFQRVSHLLAAKYRQVDPFPAKPSEPATTTESNGQNIVIGRRKKKKNKVA